MLTTRLPQHTVPTKQNYQQKRVCNGHHYVSLLLRLTLRFNFDTVLFLYCYHYRQLKHYDSMKVEKKKLSMNIFPICHTVIAPYYGCSMHIVQAPKTAYYSKNIDCLPWLLHILCAQIGWLHHGLYAANFY